MLDNYVYACPLVKAEISGGKAVISGHFTEKEALDIANILQTGPLPLPVTIVEENFRTVTVKPGDSVTFALFSRSNVLQVVLQDK